LACWPSAPTFWVTLKKFGHAGAAVGACYRTVRFIVELAIAGQPRT